VLDDLLGPDAVVPLEQVIDGAAKRQVKQARKQLGREPSPLQRQRRPVRQPDPDDLDDEAAGGDGQVPGSGLVGSSHGRGEDLRAGQEALPA
jgi:hypothetical protein